MFSNIGRKIKILAQVICWAGITLSVISGLVLLGLNDHNGPFALLIILIGTLLSWIGSFFTYGFGELIEKTCSIEKQLNSKKNSGETKAASQKSSQVEKCSSCGKATNHTIRHKVNDTIGWVDICEECYEKNK